MYIYIYLHIHLYDTKFPYAMTYRQLPIGNDYMTCNAYMQYNHSTQSHTNAIDNTMTRHGHKAIQ